MGRQDFEGGTNGTTITTSNAGGSGQDQFTSVSIGSGAAVIFDNSRVAHGSLSCKQSTGASASACSVRWTATGGTDTTAYVRFYLNVSANPPATQRILSVLNDTQTQYCCWLELRTDGRINIFDGSATNVFTTTQAVNLNGWTRIEVKIIASLTVGQLSFRMYKTPDSTVPDENLTTAANRNTGTVIALWDFGQTYGAIANTTTWYDSLGTSITDWLGPRQLSTASNNFDGGVAGTTITPTNAGGPGNAQFDYVTLGAGNTAQFYSGSAHGPLSLQIGTAATPGVGSAVGWNLTIGSRTTVYIRFYLWVGVIPSNVWRIFSIVNLGGGSLSGAIELEVDGRLAIIDGSGSPVLFTGPTIGVGGWNRVEAKFVASATAGQVGLRLYTNMDSATPDSDLLSAANRNVPTPMGGYEFGNSRSPSGNVGGLWIDDVAVSVIDWLGPIKFTYSGSVNLIATPQLKAGGYPVNISFTVTPTLTITGYRVMGTGAVMVAAPTLLVTGSRPLQFALVTLIAHVNLLIKGAPPPRIPQDIFTRQPIPPQTYPFRVIAQEILTGKFVDWDLPVQDDFSYTTQLSGPASMTGAFQAEIESIQQLGLDGYAYFFHVEISGEVRATGIFLPPQNDDSTVTFTCEGFSSILHYVTWGGQLSEIGIDPLDVARLLWSHVQNNPRSNLGVIVSQNTSDKKLGTAARTEIVKNTDGTTQPNDIAAAPYELVWWEAPNCGETFDNLSTQTPFDWKERVSWNTTKTDVDLFIDLGYPRLGAPRDKLLFNEENVLEVVPVQEGDDTYASEVLVVGAGEGSASIWGYAAEPFGNRVRKVEVITDKTISTTQRANAVAAAELGLRKGSNFSIDELVILARHENATIGEYDIGDDIFVQVIIPWLIDPHRAWYRILSITYQPAHEIVRLKVALSSSFDYSTTPTEVAPVVSDDVLAAQAIMDRMKGTDVIYEDWTWPDCPDYVNVWNDSLINSYINAGYAFQWPEGIPNMEAWLQRYILARV